MATSLALPPLRASRLGASSGRPPNWYLSAGLGSAGGGFVPFAGWAFPMVMAATAPAVAVAAVGVAPASPVTVHAPGTLGAASVLSDGTSPASAERKRPGPGGCDVGQARRQKWLVPHKVHTGAEACAGVSAELSAGLAFPSTGEEGFSSSFMSASSSGGSSGGSWLGAEPGHSSSSCPSEVAPPAGMEE